MSDSELKLTLAEYDPGPTPQFDDHFTFDVELSAGGFAGRTYFIASRPHLLTLLSDISELDRTLKGRFDWQAGWGEREHFGLAVCAVGHTGRLVLEARLASPIAETNWARQVVGIIGIMPNTLRCLRDDFSAILARPLEGEAVTICGDPDAAI